MMNNSNANNISSDMNDKNNPLTDTLAEIIFRVLTNSSRRNGMG